MNATRILFTQTTSTQSRAAMPILRANTLVIIAMMFLICAIGIACTGINAIASHRVKYSVS